MFNFFKKDSKKILQKEYEKLMHEAFILSSSNRKLSDAKYAEANQIITKIEKL